MDRTMYCVPCKEDLRDMFKDIIGKTITCDVMYDKWNDYLMLDVHKKDAVHLSSEKQVKQVPCGNCSTESQTSPDNRNTNHLKQEKRQNGRRFKEAGEPMFTLTGQDIHGIYNGKTIRNLTPTEYFRLMGFLEDEINLEGISNTRRYNLAGNGWDVNLVSKIFKQMFVFPEKGGQNEE